MRSLLNNVIIPLLSMIIVGYFVSIPSATSEYALYTNDSKPYGIPYGEWIGKWWTWWMGIPNNLHPANDYSDPKRCSVMQAGPVWFLPDVVTGRSEERRVGNWCRAKRWQF